MNKLFKIFIRYVFLFAIGLGNLWVFYTILAPLTLYLSYLIISIFKHASLIGSTIVIDNYSILISNACVAGSAFYLLFILNLSTPMSLKKRAFSLLFSCFIFLAINIIRIVLFSLILTKSFSLFNSFHLLFWYFLSGIIVFLVWIATIKLFEIKSYPIYSDISYMIKKIKSG